MQAMLRVALESPEQADVVELIGELDRYLSALYAPQHNHLLDIESLKRPNVLFVVARDVGGDMMGCAAVVSTPPFGELKRMMVRSQNRNRGVAKALLGFLERAALQAGCRLLRLETGIHQPEALGLYERSGFQRCAAFGDYADDPMSVFMQKPIA